MEGDIDMECLRRQVERYTLWISEFKSDMSNNGREKYHFALSRLYEARGQLIATLADSQKALRKVDEAISGGSN